jgi:hypothetical protein
MAAPIKFEKKQTLGAVKGAPRYIHILSDLR